jgi:hypothetical protein
VASLADLVAPDLSVAVISLRRRVILAGGRELGTISLERSPLLRAMDQPFRRRLLRLDVESPELDSVWRIEVGGRPLADAVHLFPANLFTPQGLAKGRGFELRDPKGVVIGYTDQTRQSRGRRAPTLLYRDGRGQLKAQCTAEGFRRHLTFAGADGAARFDLVRGRRPVMWEAPWVRASIPEEERAALGGLLILALLWV